MRKNPDVIIQREKRGDTAAHVGRAVSLATRSSPSPRDALSAEDSALVPTPVLQSQASHSHAPAVDQLKFRIVARRGKHYFQDVRFKGSLTLEAITVIKFLEGRCLESLSSRTLQNGLGHIGIVPHLESLLKDLRQVLCD
jgi:hypothetical protein